MFSLAGVRFAAFAAFVTVIAGGQAFASTENISTSRGVYWAVTTMTTVGYGDVTPTTGTSELIAIAVMLVGIGFVAILTGAVAERFIEPRAEARDDQGQADLHNQLREITERLAAIERALQVRPGDASDRPRLAS